MVKMDRSTQASSPSLSAAATATQPPAYAGTVRGPLVRARARSAPQRGEVAPRPLDGDGTVAGHAGEVEPFDGSVAEGDRNAALSRPVVVVMWGVGLREESAGEDDPGGLLPKRQLHVIVLGNAASGLRAEGRSESLGDEWAADDLGECWEYGALQLGKCQAGEPGPLASETPGSSLRAGATRRGLTDPHPCAAGASRSAVHATLAQMLQAGFSLLLNRGDLPETGRQRSAVLSDVGDGGCSSRRRGSDGG